MKISSVDQILNAERRYYVALHQYANALKSASREVEQLRLELCDAFSELSNAHERLALDCEEQSADAP